MTRGWVIAGVCLGAALGFGTSASLGAFQPQDKGGPPRPDGTEQEVVAAAQTGTATTDTKFVEIEPVRAFDSRIAAYVASGTFAPNTSRVVAVRDGHDNAGAVTRPDAVPVGATAIAYNVTVASPTSPNFVAITPGNATAFTTSAVNFNGTSDVANAGIVSIDANRTVKIWNGDQSGTTHVIIDVTGYFVKPIFAHVRSDGGLESGSRVVSVTKAGTGGYDVKFDRPVFECARVVTIGGTSAAAAGVIDTSLLTVDTVTVFTQTNDGVPPAFADRPFHLTVIC